MHRRGSCSTVLKVGDGGHSGFRHVVLSEHCGYFLCAVVAVVEEYHCVTLPDGAVDISVDDGF